MEVVWINITIMNVNAILDSLDHIVRQVMFFHIITSEKYQSGDINTINLVPSAARSP